jgi:hypothetical protein
MSRGTVVKLSPGDQLKPPMSHAVVAAQLRGEAAAESTGAAVVDAIAEQIEGLGLVPDLAELHHRYADADERVRQLAQLRRTA